MTWISLGLARDSDSGAAAEYPLVVCVTQPTARVTILLIDFLRGLLLYLLACPSRSGRVVVSGEYIRLGNHNENPNMQYRTTPLPHPPHHSLRLWWSKRADLHLLTKQRNTMMDVTFVLEESGVTATVEVPCEANVAAAKEVACTALAVSPASVEMRIGTQVLEVTCRLQDTAFDAGVQVVLARRFADIKCPAQYNVKKSSMSVAMSLSRCGTLCIYVYDTNVGGFDTETFARVLEFNIPHIVLGPPAISQCKTRCYLPCEDCLLEVALPGGEVVRKVDGYSGSVFACGGVVVSKGKDGVSVYDEDLTLLHSLSHEGCRKMAVSDCGGWVITYSSKEKNTRLWDVNTGEAVACVPLEGGWCGGVALSRSASVFAVAGEENDVHLYDWSGAALRSVDVHEDVKGIQFTPCGEYLVVRTFDVQCDERGSVCVTGLHQYDVATMSRVRVISQERGESSEYFAISPCSRVVVSMPSGGVLVTRHLYPHNSE